MARLRVLCIAAALALCAAAAPPAPAAPNLETGIADDAALARPDAPQTVAAWAALGIDDVRVFAQWGRISPGRGDERAPAGFDAANPGAPGYDWSALDRAVALVRDAGMTVTLSITGPGPLWATARPSSLNPRRNPVPAQFGRFARAVAARYGAQVDRYIVWNEPNLPLWLQPQFRCSGRSSCTPASPGVYRALVRAATPAIHAADPGSRVLIGALAPAGQNAHSTNATMRPLAFLRALGCIDARGRRDRRGACRGFRPAAADGIAYHPHGVRRAPDARTSNPDDAGLADLPRLEALIDTIQRRGGLRNTLGRARKFDLHLTEYGYQTNPPDRFVGVRPAQQAAWLQQGAYLAWRDPRVRTMTQYVWRDERLGSNGAGWQSGLRFADDRPKPALRGFPQPFWADPTVGRRVARLWGQVRPGSAHAVTVQRRTPGTARWSTVRRPQTDGRGFFALRVRVTRRIEYRFAWQPDGGGAVQTSDARRLAPR
jgi:hypothetical protein